MRKIFKNWKTTFCGIATIFTGVKQIITTGDLAGSINTIMLGIGLIFAKDYNVTGSGHE